MELDVTHMVEDADNMPLLFGSVAELGGDAERLTWGNSKFYGASHPLLTTDEARDAARSHFREYGAWSEEEIAAWSEDELQAIMVQDVAAAVREMELAHGDDAEYERLVDAGTLSARLFKGQDGHWHYYLGF